MTVQDVIRQALALLGYTDTRADGEIPGGNTVYKRAVPLVAQITAELWYRDHATSCPAIRDLHTVIPLDAVTSETVLPYGVAMLLAQTDGDADNQTLFATLYDGRRTSTKTAAHITDVLPRVR